LPRISNRTVESVRSVSQKEKEKEKGVNRRGKRVGSESERGGGIQLDGSNVISLFIPAI
jgi:hypothetical protein